MLQAKSVVILDQVSVVWSGHAALEHKVLIAGGQQGQYWGDYYSRQFQEMGRFVAREKQHWEFQTWELDASLKLSVLKELEPPCSDMQEQAAPASKNNKICML